MIVIGIILGFTAYTATIPPETLGNVFELLDLNSFIANHF